MRFRGCCSHRRTAYVAGELASFGLEVDTQPYAFYVPHRGGVRAIRGTNVYARMRAPRTDGREALVLAASWRSRWRQLPTNGADLPYVPHDDVRRAANVRGVASVLALAQHATTIPNWSKDLFFVLSDGYLEGMQAWATQYFGQPLASLDAAPVRGAGAQIWNALALDYPSDSFTSLSLLHEGRDGQLPNLDTLNIVGEILRVLRMNQRLGLHGAPYEAVHYAVPTVDTLAAWGVPSRVCAWLREALGPDGVASYFAGWLALAAQWRLQLAGHPSGIHGVLLPFHVDAFTLFAEPAPGPSGFLQLGTLSEGVMRTFSNLLERLHHSQFFYLLLSPGRFVQIAVFIFVPLLLAAALTLTGLALWNALGARRDAVRRELRQRAAADAAPHGAAPPLLESPTYDELARLAPPPADGACAAFRATERPVVSALACVGAAHLAGIACLACVALAPVDCARAGLLACHAYLACVAVVVVAPPLLAATCAALLRVPLAPLGMCLHAFALLHGGMVASVLATINFAQAASMALLLCVTLYPVRPPWGMHGTDAAPRGARAAATYSLHAVVMVAATPPMLVALAAALWPPAWPLAPGAAEVVSLAVWDWHMLHTSALPVLLVGYMPAALEGAAACWMYSAAVAAS